MQSIESYSEVSRIFYAVKTDLKGNYTYVSPYFAETFCHYSKEWYGGSCLLLIHSKDQLKCLEAINKCLEQPKSFQNIILRQSLLSGEFIWIKWELHLESDGKNLPKEVIWYGHRMTKDKVLKKTLKKAGREFEAQEIKYQTLFETSSLAIILHTPEGEIFDANQTFCDLLKMSKSEILNRSLYDFTPEKQWHQDREFIKQLTIDSKSSSYEKNLVNAQGEQFPVSVNMRVFHGKDGRLFIWNIIKDISERKKHRELLESQNDFLAKTADMAKLGGWQINLETMETLWTKEVYKIHELDEGYRLDISEAILFYHPDDREKITLAINEAISSGKPYDLILRFISAKNNPKWIRTSGHPIFNDGKVAIIRGIIQDVSDKKRNEETILKQNILLRDVYFTQSHVIRLPIANILGLSDLLDYVSTEEDKKEIYQKIKHSVTQLDNILRDVVNRKTEGEV